MTKKNKHFDKGFVWVLIALAIMVVILIIGAVTGAAIWGDRTGVGSGSNSPGGGTGSDSTVPIVANTACGQSILDQAQQYAGVMYSQKVSNGTHCGYPVPQGRAGADHLDCSGIVSRVYRELGLLTPSTACYGTSTIPGSSQLQEISASQIQPGDIVNIAGSHVVFYVGGNINGDFSTFSCKRDGVPCGTGSWWHISGQRYYHPAKCNDVNKGAI